jgi:two-component system, chemotaxis family, protein-glutamate methylesterase/glutaminase
MSLAAPAASAAQLGRPVRVMIVDDAVVVRGLMARWFQEAGGIEVASTHRSGSEAVAAIGRVRPDVVVLDIEMPDMDGLTALPLLLKTVPDTVVIIASTLTTRNAEISLKCLSLGAIDYIAKPSTNRDVTFSTDFRRDVVEKVRTLGQRRRQRPLSRPAAGNPVPSSALAKSSLRPPSAALHLRPMVKVRPSMLLIGASTGGPHAVTELLKLTRPALQRLPIVVAQHMPATFTAMFAEHLKRTLGVDASEAQHGDPIESGRIYIAPGGRHLKIERGQSGVRAAIADTPPVNFCRPSVDVTFQSAAKVYGGSALGVMLTGMGSDGTAGAAELIQAGGNLLAQDEASSIVWGMPGSVAKRGLCAAVEPVPKLAQIINIMAGAGQS